MKDLYLIGGGGHCKSCIDVIEACGKYQIKGIFDLEENIGKLVLGYEIIGCDKDLEDYKENNNLFLITIGQIKSSELREKYLNKNLNLATIISPRAYVSKHAQISAGTIIMHDAIVNAGAKIGKNCIINTKALIEHDSVIEDNCHIATGAIINGDCYVEECSFIGSGAVVKNGNTIPAKSIVPYGSCA